MAKPHDVCIHCRDTMNVNVACLLSKSVPESFSSVIILADGPNCNLMFKKLKKMSAFIIF